jgi:hypothetical protein
MDPDEGLEYHSVEPAAGVPLAAPVEVEPEAAPPRATSPDPRPRALLVLAVVVVLIGAVGIVYDAVEGNGPDPNSALESAVVHSTNAKTAGVAMSLSLGVAGAHESIEGNGTANFRTDASNMTMTYDVGGRSLVERVIVDGPVGYFNVGPLVGEVAPGKSWVSMDLSTGASGPNGVAGGGILSDPNTMVDVLRAGGTTVTMLGSSTVDGSPVQGYAIHLSPAGIQETISSEQVPPSLKAQMSQAHFDRLDYEVYIDGANYLKEIRTVGSFGAGGLGATVTSTMHFSNYGIPVRVVPPPADEVIPFSEFQKLEAQSQGPTTT